MLPVTLFVNYMEQFASLSCICNLDTGYVVPIPTLPFESNDNIEFVPATANERPILKF